jgi:hypothetical protein
MGKKEDVSLESLYDDGISLNERLDQIEDPKALGMEDCKVIKMPWKGQIQFQIEISNQFRIDWKDATGEAFRVNSDLYISLCTYILNLHNKNLHTYSCADTTHKIRRFKFSLSSSGVSKQHDARILFCLYKRNAKIFLAAIASQKEHHKDDKDLKAISRAQTAISNKSLELQEGPA